MPFLINHYYPDRKVIFFLGQRLLLFTALHVVEYLFSYHVLTTRQKFPLIGVGTKVVPLTLQLSLYFFDLDNDRGAMLIQKLLSAPKSGLQGKDGISLYQALTGQVFVKQVRSSWFIVSRSFDITRESQADRNSATRKALPKKSLSETGI